MNTREVIESYNEYPFATTEQTALVRARNGVLMAKLSNVSPGHIRPYDPHDHSVVESDSERRPDTGAYAKARTIKEVPTTRHPQGKFYREPERFFFDNDLTRNDWVPLCVAIPKDILGTRTEEEVDRDGHTSKYYFIGTHEPGSWSPIFNHNTLLQRRDATYAYSKLMRDMIMLVPQPTAYGVRIPARSRKVDPMNILIRIFTKMFVDTCGPSRAEMNWQLGWMNYLTSQASVRVNARNKFGACVSQLLNSQPIQALERNLPLLKQAVANQEPLDYLDTFKQFRESLNESYNADGVDTDVVGCGFPYVVSHIAQHLMPVDLRGSYYHVSHLYKYINKDWKTLPTFIHNHHSDSFERQYEEASAKCADEWAELFRTHAKGTSLARSDRDDFMGLYIRDHKLLRNKWPHFVDLFERLGFSEPKPFGFSYCDEDEESLAVMHEAAVNQVSDPASIIEAEAEQTMSILG